MSLKKCSLSQCSADSEQKLEASDEICLSAFVDGECGWLRRFFARRSLQKNYQARRFVDELERTSNQMQDFYKSELGELTSDGSLWSRISSRIAQEERLSLLRAIPVQTSSPLDWAFRLRWCGMGAVAASLFFVFISPFKEVNLSGEMANNMNSVSEVRFIPSESALSSNKMLSQVSAPQESAPGQDYYRALQIAALQASRQHNRNLHSYYDSSGNIRPDAFRFIPQPSEQSEAIESAMPSLNRERRLIAPQVFEVDWVRSKGRVKVLQDPSGKAAIIWVHRPRPEASAVPAIKAPAIHPEYRAVGNR